MTDDPTDLRLLRYLDGALSTEEASRLSEALEQHPELRRRLRDLAEHAFAIGEAGRCQDARTPASRAAASPGVTVPSRVPRREVLWAALAALVVLGTFLVLEMRPPKPLLEVVTVRGAATWSDGRQRLPLQAGTRLPAGTIEAESDKATVEVRFADQSRFALTGSAEAVFRESDHKQVQLRRGSFTATVARQPDGRPLRVRTRTAEVEVLGTVFTLDALPEQTELSVAEGRVRLKRLVDDQAVEVAARQRVTASFNASEPLVPEPMQTSATEWHLDVSRPPERLTGLWHPASEGEPAFIGATPTVEQRREDGRVFVHQSVIVRAASKAPADTFALLTADSVLRLKLRLQRSFPLQLMISTRHPDGSFAGNFELVKVHDALAGDGAWHWLDVPFRDFAPLSPPRGASVAGRQVSAVIITTLHEPVGLEVAGISILPTPRPTDVNPP